MKNKGFTLIELLAVIVILAIIALIATPIILNIINDSRKSSIDRTAELIGSEIQLAYSSYMMNVSATSATASADDYCTYMASSGTVYFHMDGATLESCGSNSAVIDVNGNDYTAAYSGGTVTITYSGGNVSSKTVTMK